MQSIKVKLRFGRDLNLKKSSDFIRAFFWDKGQRTKDEGIRFWVLGFGF